MSTWSGDGHFPASGSHSQRQNRQTRLGRSATAATKHRGEAADSGRDTGAGCVGGASSASPRCERQLGVWLAPSLLGRTTWGAEARDQVAARTGEREFAAASVGGGLVRRLAELKSGTIHIELREAQVRIEGSADPALVRVLLECLRG